MPMKCENCGHIHWDDRPALKETYDLLKEEKSLTTSKVAHELDISLQNANNRLSKIEGLGACYSNRVPQETGGYIRRYVLKKSSHAV